MEKPALFVGDAEAEEQTLNEAEVRDRMSQGLPAQSAEEYLLRVRIESNDLPDVVEAHVPEAMKKTQTNYMPSTEPVPQCPPQLLPNEEWERGVLSTFVELRQYLRRWKGTNLGNPAQREPVPALKDGPGWHIFCLGCVEGEDNAPGAGGETGLRIDSNSTALTTTTTAGPGGKNVSFDDDDAQSTFCVGPVESHIRFDSFSATLAKTAEREQDGKTGQIDEEDAENDRDDSANQLAKGGEALATEREPSADEKDAKDLSETTPAETSGADLSAAGGKGDTAAVVVGGAGGNSGSGSQKRPYGKEWLRTHPRGTPPTLKLAIQFDQVLTQKVLAFHAEWLKTNLLSRARAVWIYTLLACLEKPLGSETAALVREVLRRCCAQRAELESSQDESLPALNVIVVIAGTFFQQAEMAVS